MGKHHLRKDSTCENCGHTVEQRFCSYCGQENIETRMSFGHLVRHFAEDFTHYEGSFWKTIKYLLLRPGYLTKNYLAGKRVSYVVPVKLYIFISFIAFFTQATMPHYESSENGEGPIKFHTTPETKKNASARKYHSLREYDSVQQALPVEKRDGLINRRLAITSIRLYENPEDMTERLGEQFTHTFPKALFVYLPLFAFVVWLFHNKRKRLYFDHAIFTLHYFSFVLLLYTVFLIVNNIAPWEKWFGSSLVTVTLTCSGVLWTLYYFFRAHRKVYEESRVISRLKSFFILALNAAIFSVILAFLLVFVVLTVH